MMFDKLNMETEHTSEGSSRMIVSGAGEVADDTLVAVVIP